MCLPRVVSGTEFGSIEKSSSVESAALGAVAMESAPKRRYGLRKVVGAMSAGSLKGTIYRQWWTLEN